MAAATNFTEMESLLGGRRTSLPFSINSLRVVSKRYLLRTHEGTPTEIPEEMFARVAKALANVEADYGASAEEIEGTEKSFRDIMMNFEFTPAGRTLANAGGPTRLVSNCIVLHVDDSMEGIFQTLKDAALLQKAGSGLGFPLHLLRPAGSLTKESFGTASGPVSFLHVYNTAFGVIKQQNRHGANMAVMKVDHPDILEFVHCKDKEGDIKNFNVSVGLTDEFMRQVRDDCKEPWMCNFKGLQMKPRRISRDPNFSFVSATEVTMTAKELFQEIIDCAWKTGEPGCVFLDTVNANNPLPGLGRIEACNPCGEQFLHDGDVCNLGSINLEKFVKDGKVDYEKLARVTKLSVQLLDNVIDLSSFPVEKVNSTFRGNRRVGLGIMGFADMLYQMEVGYNSQEGRDIAETVMKCIQDSGDEASRELAERKGCFPNWDKSVFAQKGIKRRNAAITNVPPTGTISMMFDVSGGVEPYFALAYYYKGILGGMQLSYVNKHLKAALEKYGQATPDLMDKVIRAGSVQAIPEIHPSIKKTFVTSMDISAEDHILMQAAFQRQCDNAISKTINFPNKATKADILTGYLYAWEHKCKGCTVYRDGSRFEQVLNLNNTKTDEEKAKEAAVSAAANSTSADVNSLASEVSAIKITEKKEIVLIETPLVTEVVAGKKRKVVGSMSKHVENCPDCTDTLILQEGCCLCRTCGYSKCSM